MHKQVTLSVDQIYHQLLNMNNTLKEIHIKLSTITNKFFSKN